MFFERKGLMIGFGIVALFVAIYVARAYVLPTSYEDLFQQLLACSSAKNPTSCARPPISKMLTSKTGSEILADLSGEMSAEQCHYAGHVVGQESYIKFKDVETALAQCSYLCDSACVHGVIGESFAEELGYTDVNAPLDIDFAHLSAEEISTVGRRLCLSSKTCHGVGHALFQAYKSFKPALSMCDKSAPPGKAMFCYHGVFMEYGDILASRSMRDAPQIVPPSVESINTMCQYEDPEAKRSCFRYLTKPAMVALKQSGLTTTEAFDHMKGVCASYSSLVDRLSCTAGLGVYWSYSLATDTEFGHKLCGGFSDMRDRATCNVGLLSVATLERQDNIMKFCSEETTSPLRQSCYQGMYFVTAVLGGSVEELASKCRDEECKTEVKNAGMEPMQRALQLFGRS